MTQTQEMTHAQEMTQTQEMTHTQEISHLLTIYDLWWTVPEQDMIDKDNESSYELIVSTPSGHY